MSKGLLGTLIKDVDKAVMAVDDAPENDWIDTGSYVLNALLSGSIYGGYPATRISMLAGNSQVGKSFMALHAVKNFLIKHKDNENAMVIYIDTENAIDRSNFESFNIDVNKVARVEAYSIGDCKTVITKVFENYFKSCPTKKERKENPLLVILDSIGMLPTAKEVNDARDEKETQDMTRARDMGSLMRILTTKAGANRIPVIITNHVYSEIGMFPKDVLKGGKMVEYAPSSVPMLTRSKDKEGSEIVGLNVRAKMYKSRFTKTEQSVVFNVKFDSGLSRYYGLVDFALESGAFEKASTRILLPDGSKVWQKDIYKTPEEFFTPDVMEKIEAWVNKSFKLGTSAVEETISEAIADEVSED